jgi:hypothetical protein
VSETFPAEAAMKHAISATAWQEASRRLYARARAVPTAGAQARAAHASHMARRALFTLVNGQRKAAR